MRENIPVYDVDALCPVCGHEEVASHYYADTATYSCRSHWDSLGGVAHLHRVCQRCGFVWEERPLDEAAVTALRRDRDERRRIETDDDA